MNAKRDDLNISPKVSNNRFCRLHLTLAQNSRNIDFTYIENGMFCVSYVCLSFAGICNNYYGMLGDKFIC